MCSKKRAPFDLFYLKKLTFSYFSSLISTNLHEVCVKTLNKFILVETLRDCTNLAVSLPVPV